MNNKQASRKISTFYKMLTIAFTALIYALIYKLCIESTCGSNWLHSILDILYVLSLSLVASFIFYFFTIILPHRDKIKSTKEIISPIIDGLCHSVDNIIEDVSGNCSHSQLNADSWDSICSKIKYKDYNQYTIRNFFRASGKYDNWIGYFSELIKKEDEDLQTIFLMKNSLDENVIAFALQLGNKSELFTYLNYEFKISGQTEIKSANGDGIHLSGISKYIWRHFELIDHLKTAYYKSIKL